MNDKQKALLMLTKEWQNVALYEWNHSSGAKCTFYVDAKLSTDQSIIENKSLVDIRLRSVLGAYSTLSGSGYKFTCTNCPTIEGSGNSVWNFETEVITSSANKEIIHEDDGTKELEIKATLYNGYLGLNEEMTATVQLPTIARKSTISCSSPFNIRDNVTLNINSKNASFTHTIRYNFENVGERVIAENVTGETSIPYPWATPSTMYTDGDMENKISGTGYLTVETFVNDTSIGVSEQFPFTANVTNSNPTVDAVIVDSNTNIVDNYTGDEKILVNGLSTAKITATANTKNGSTLAGYKVACEDGQTKTGYPEATITRVKSGIFNLSVTDSRGLTGTKKIEVAMKDYFKPYAVEMNIGRTEQTSTEIKASLIGKWWNDNFGIKQNTLNYSYRIREAGGTWSLWVTRNEILKTSGNDFSLETSLGTNFDTKKAYDIQFRLKDEVDYYELNSEQVTVSIPILEVYDDEVAIFGDGYIQNNLIVGDLKCRNLFNKNLYSFNYIKSCDTGTNAYYYNVPVYVGKANTKYYLKTEYLNDYTCIGVSNLYVLVYPNEVGEWLSIGHTSAGKVNGILLSDELGYVYLRVFKTLSEVDYNNLMKNSNIQISEGTSDEPYTPYKVFGIVESGVNDNGEWIKYDDGTMICNHQLICENQQFNYTSGNLFYCPIVPTWTYPQPFIDDDINIQANCQFSDRTEIGGLNSWIIGKNQTNVTVWSSTNVSKTFTVHFKAKGRWK